MLNQVPFTYRKRGVFYYNRTVPKDLSGHYKSRRINFSLRTKSSREARRVSISVSIRLESYWEHLRFQDINLPGTHLSSAASNQSTQTTQLTFTDAVDLYVKLKGRGKPDTFARSAHRARDYLEGCSGRKDLADLKRADAIKLRDHLIRKGLVGSSIARIFTTIKAVLNFVIAEMDLDLKNPFRGVYLDKSQGVSERQPIPLRNIRMIQAECYKLDDDIRWAIALLSDTGMRLAEVIGLATEDIKLAIPTPYIHLKPHPWRPLKTTSSERYIPLVGAALWAATRIKDTQTQAFAFPRYTSLEICNANSASGALNKWLKSMTPAGCTIHSFRHSMRDRLRAAQCPSDVIDQIGGWAAHSIGERYGNGYQLSILSEWLTSAMLGN